MKKMFFMCLGCIFSMTMNFCFAVEDILKTKEIFRPAQGFVKIIDYKPSYGGSTYRKNSISNLFEALYFASPTLGHTDFPDNPVLGTPYTPQKIRENKAIREHLTTVGLQAEQDALDMIRKLDDPNRLVTEEHWDRMSALDYAVATQRVKIVEAMLSRGIDKKLLNQKSGNGRTPLSLAVWRDNIKMIKMLVDAGADPNVASRWDGTPIEMIRKKIKDLKEEEKDTDSLFKNKQRIKENLIALRSRDADPYQNLAFEDSLEQHTNNILRGLERTKERILEYKSILAIFKSAPQPDVVSSSPKPTPSTKPVKSALQKSLSNLHKQLAQLKKKLEKLSKDLQALKGKLS